MARGYGTSSTPKMTLETAMKQLLLLYGLWDTAQLEHYTTGHYTSLVSSGVHVFRLVGLQVV